MGGVCILVVGEHFRNQLDKYQSEEYAPPLSPHYVTNDVLFEARRHHKSHYREKPFTDMLRSRYGMQVLPDGEKPDLADRHRHGWMRLGSNGAVREAIRRTIPNSNHFFFSGTPAEFLLKIGASGKVFRGDQAEPPIEGFAGQARKCDIDFESMDAALRSARGKRWDHARSLVGTQTWFRHNQLWNPAAGTPWDAEAAHAAICRWLEQPAVKTLVDDIRAPGRIQRFAGLSRLDGMATTHLWSDATPVGIDPLGLPREEFVQRGSIWGPMCGFGDVIHNYVLIKHEKRGDSQKFIDDLPDDALMTLAACKA